MIESQWVDPQNISTIPRDFQGDQMEELIVHLIHKHYLTFMMRDWRCWEIRLLICCENKPY